MIHGGDMPRNELMEELSGEVRPTGTKLILDLSGARLFPSNCEQVLTVVFPNEQEAQIPYSAIDDLGSFPIQRDDSASNGTEETPHIRSVRRPR
jgi:hypothetical protein